MMQQEAGTNVEFADHPLTLFFTTRPDMINLKCKPSLSRDRLDFLLQRHGIRKSVVCILGADKQLYPWYAGALAHFAPLTGYAHNTVGYLNDDPNMCENVVAHLDGSFMGFYTVPAALVDNDKTLEAIYLQYRLQHPDVPPLHLVVASRDTTTAPTSFSFAKRWKEKKYTPTMVGGTALMYMLSIPVAELRRFHRLCDRCGKGFMEAGRCLGGYYTYVMHDDSTLVERFDCPNAPGLDPGFGDGFSDRTRFSQRQSKSKYLPRYHFKEVITAHHGTQNTAIDPNIIRDVRLFAEPRGWLDNQERLLAKQVKHALMTLESYYPGTYDKWYQDAQLIATKINGDRAAVDIVIPEYHQRLMVDIYDSAVAAWNRAPPEVRGNRRNFLQNNYNIWVVATIAAHRHGDARFLDYRQIVVNPDGTPPRLRDDNRQHEYENIWKWIIQYNNWGEIEI